MDSRNPANRATITKMSPELVARYERVKSGGVVGWSSQRDPWGWVTQQPGQPWERSAFGGHPSAWPPR